MKKLTLQICLLMLCVSILNAQNPKEIEKVIRSVADNILENSTFKMKNTRTGETFEIVNESSGKVKDLEFDSKYNEWKYWNGVLNIAFDELAMTLDEEKYGDFSERNIRFAFQNYEYFKKYYEGQGLWRYPFAMMFDHTQLDDCGAMGASLIQVYRDDKQKEYRDYINRTAEYIMYEQEQLDDGMLCRPTPEEMTIWGDDLYMSVPFLARMGDLSGEQKYFDFAVHQVKKFYEYLYDPHNGLSYHCYFTNSDAHGVAYWGRANGWMLMGTAELLKYLPEDHPGRSEVIRLLEKAIVGLSRYQGPDGMWHQLLDKVDSYKESSCTAMFVYSIALGINEGWIDDRHANIAKQGWKGLTGMITADGKVRNICRGLPIHHDLTRYYNHGTPLNDIHGLGAVLLAGTEMIKLTR